MIDVAIILAVAGLSVLVRRWPNPAEDRFLKRIGRVGLFVAPILVLASTLTIVAPGEVAIPVLFGSAQAPLDLAPATEM